MGVMVRPYVLEMTDLHIKRAFIKSKIFTVFILWTVEVSLVNFLDAVLNKARKSNSNLNPTAMDYIQI